MRILSYMTLLNNNFISLCYCVSSMGGHGALISALKNPGKFRSVSAFAPATNPSQTTPIFNIFKYYFGDNTKAMEEWDATCLVANYKGPELNLFIQQVKIDTTIY